MAKKHEARLKDIELAFEPVPGNPMITPFTRFLGIPDADMHQLYAARKGGEIELPPMPALRTVIDAGTPKEQVLRVRDYQRRAILHHALMPRYINGDAVGLGKTLCSLAGACAIDHRLGDGQVKVIIFCTTTNAYQWESEVKRFTTLRPFVLKDSYQFKGDAKPTHGHAARVGQLQRFLTSPKLQVLICRYSQWVGKRRKVDGPLDADGRPVNSEGKENLSQEIRDLRDGLKGYRDRLVMITDETHKIKTAGTQIRNMIQAIQRRFKWSWGLTATAIKNHLEEFYSISSAIGIAPLGSLNRFRDEYCKWQALRMGKRLVHKITGYTHIQEFKVGMRPFYWGRSQAQVKEPLPRLTTLFHPVELSPLQSKLILEDIPSGAYVLPPTVRKVAGEYELVERDPSNLMTMLSVMQLVSNTPALLDRNDPKIFLNATLSAKEEVLLDLLDGDLAGEKVIVFSKYRSWIDRLEALTKDGKFTDRKFLRITGAEKGRTRENMRTAFQDDPDCNLIFINTAAIESVNLQQAAHLICLDMPWSWGDVIQLVGRMVRMASPHSACTLHILTALGTVDEYVLDTLMSKKGVFERILGSAGTAGILDDGDDAGVDLSQDLDNAALGLESEDDDKFLDLLKAHARKVGMRPYVTGVVLAKEVAGMRDVKKEKRERDVDIEDLESRW